MALYDDLSVLYNYDVIFSEEHNTVVVAELNDGYESSYLEVIKYMEFLCF